MEEDWDLYAVVRGCSTVTFTPTTTTTASSVSSCGYSVFAGEQEGENFPFPYERSMEELHELCKPFFSKSLPPSLQLQSSYPLSSFSYSSSPLSAQTQISQQKQQQRCNNHPHNAGSVTTSRSKRRKNQMKKVCQVPVENLSSDVWAWRKYGQKPIKGSPYPRGYYRCSSSKGCLARKMVERNRSDPTMFIVTYTAEHNHPAPTHRNSLAGSTRQKPLTPKNATTGYSNKSLSTKPPTSPNTSGAEEEEVPPQGGAKSESESKEEKELDLMEDIEEEEDEFGLSDFMLTDDFFQSLDELSQLTESVASVTGDYCFTDPFLSGISLPDWVATNSATAAGGS